MLFADLLRATVRRRASEPFEHRQTKRDVISLVANSLRQQLTLLQPESFLTTIKLMKNVEKSLKDWVSGPGGKSTREQGIWFKNIANGLAGLMTILFDVDSFAFWNGQGMLNRNHETAAHSLITAFLQQTKTSNKNCEGVVVGIVQCKEDSSRRYTHPKNSAKTNFGESPPFLREIDRYLASEAFEPRRGGLGPFEHPQGQPQGELRAK